MTNHYSGPADRLIGRSSELAAVGAFLDQARSDGAALLIFGEPGAGKTALLDAAAEMALAAGTRVLRVAGAEFEAEISFAGLAENQQRRPIGPGLIEKRANRRQLTAAADQAADWT